METAAAGPKRDHTTAGTLAFTEVDIGDGKDVLAVWAEYPTAGVEVVVSVLHDDRTVKKVALPLAGWAALAESPEIPGRKTAAQGQMKG
jgi:hypothetical protein